MANVVDVVVKVSEQGASNVEGAVKQIGGAFGPLGSVISSVATSSTGAILGIAAAAAVVGIGAFKLGADFSEAYDTIRVGTGDTGAALDGLKESFRNVVSDVPTDFGSASTAITMLHDKLDLTGPALESLATQELNLSRITKSDVNDNIKESAALFQNWGVAAADQGSVLDSLFRTTQATGMGFGDLSTEVTTNGVKMRELGFSLQDTAALFGALDKAGISATAVMPGFSKELANSMKTGKDAKTVLADLFKEIETSPNKVKVGEDAIKIFGAKAGPQLVGAIQEGKLSFQDLENTIANGSDTINTAAKDTEHFGEKWTMFMNNIKVSVEPAATAVFDFVDSLVNKLTPAMTSVETGISSMGAAITRGGTEVTSSGFEGAMERIGLSARIAFGWMADAISSVAVPAWNELQSIARPVMDWLSANVPPILDKVSGAFSAVMDALSPVFSFIQSHQEVFERLGQGAAILAAVLIGVLVAAVLVQVAATVLLVAAIAAVAVIIGVVVAAVYSFGQILWDVFQNAKDAVASAGGAITSFFANIGQALATAASAVGNFFGNLVGWFATGLSAIGNFFSNLAGWIGTGLSAIGGFVGNVISFFQGLPARLVAGLQALPGLLMAFLGRAFDNAMFAIGFAIGTIVKLVIGLVVGIVSAVIALPGILVGIFTTVWHAVVTVVSAFAAAVVAVVAALVSAVVDFFQQLPGRAAGALSALWGVITTVFSAAKDAAVNAVMALVSAVVDFFQQLPGRAAGAVSSLWGAISGAFISAKDQATSTASSIVDSVTGFLASLPGRAASALSGFAASVTGALSSAVGAAAGIGADIVRGVANGISSGVSWVIDAAKRAAGNIISGFKSALGIGSPSKLTEELVGRPTAQGIGVGFQVESPALRRSINQSVTGWLPDAATARGWGLAAARPLVPSAAGGSGGGGGVTHVHNWTIQGSIRSDRDLMRLVRDELANQGFGGGALQVRTP